MVRHSRTSPIYNASLLITFILTCCVSCVGQISPGPEKHEQGGKSGLVQAQADATFASAQGTPDTPTIKSAVLTPTKAGTVLGPSVSATLTVTGRNLTDGYTLGFDKPVPLKTANNGTTGSAAVTLPENYTPGMPVHLALSANPNLTLSTIQTTATPAALFTVSPPTLHFPDTLIGSTSAVQSVTVTSQAAASLKVNVSAPSGDFTAPPYPCELQPSTSCTIAVSLAPKHLGDTSSSIVLSADGSLPATVPLFAKVLAYCPSEYKDKAHYALGFGSVLLIVFLYLIGIVVVRWNLVALPTRRLLLAHLDSIDSRRQIWSTPSASIASANIGTLLEKARTLNTKRSVTDLLLWTRGQELSGWGYAHEAEAELAGLLPAEIARAQLEGIEEQLRGMSSAGCAGMAERIKAALDAVSPCQLELDRPLFEDILTYFQASLAFEAELKRAIDPTSNFTVSAYQDLASRIIGLLQVQAPPLSNCIEQVLQATPPVPDPQLMSLLREADDLLNPRAAALAEQLKAASQNAAGQDQWRSLLEHVLRYLTTQTALSVRIKAALYGLRNVPTSRWKALLAEALDIVNDRTDTDFANLISWQNKTLWIVACGLLLVIALAGVLEHEVLFLVGATGGLLSRLSRSLQRADVPTDYGASWTTLFLSPVAGALAGWSGVLLIILAVQLEALGPLFSKIDWCNPSAPAALGVAFLLGFSERAFDGILGQLEDKVQATQAKSNPTQPQSLKITSPSTLNPAKLNQSYRQPLATTGGKAPYRWILASGKLPDGLQLDQSGQIIGTPTAQGPFKFTLQVSDSASGSQSQEFTIAVS
jgi:hypothetical protein